LTDCIFLEGQILELAKQCFSYGLDTPASAVPAVPPLPEPTASAPLSEPIAKPTTQRRKSNLTLAQIRDLRLSGLSVDHIANVLGVPRHRITTANKRFKIDSLPRGTKPKNQDWVSAIVSAIEKHRRNQKHNLALRFNFLKNIAETTAEFIDSCHALLFTRD